MPTGEPAGSTLNVGLFEAAIKGKGLVARRFGAISANSVVIMSTARSPLLLLEDVFRSAAVAGSIDHMLLDARYFLSEKLNPLLQFVDRQGTKILLGEHCQRALRAAGKEVVLVHTGIVDPCGCHVNKSRGL